MRRLKSCHSLSFTGRATTAMAAGILCCLPHLAWAYQPLQEGATDGTQSKPAAAETAPEEAKAEEAPADTNTSVDESITPAGDDDAAPQKILPTSQDTRLLEIEKKLDALVERLEAISAPASEESASSEPTSAATEPPSKRQGRGRARSAETSQPASQSEEAQGTAQLGKITESKDDKPQIPNMELKPEWLKDIPWRSIGPANMGGRITDLTIHPQDPSLWWLATASGGLLKSTNQGVNLEHLFDDQRTVSIGCVAADPNNKEVIWVGTGEANPRNSVSYGDGVYKSIDGGKTWKQMGLPESYQIGRILVHPENGDIVYVGVLGRLYGPNRERGVYKTTDGGTSWEQVLYVDDNTGVIDMIMHPEKPDILIAALWDRQRDGYDGWPGSEPKPDGIDGYDPIRKWGPGAGLYKTTDGGSNWTKLSQGLPPGKIGRVGLDWQLKSPHTIYAIIDCEDIGKGPKPFDAFLGLVGADIGEQPVVTQLLPESPADKAGIELGDILEEVDGAAISKWDQLLDMLRDKKLGEKISLVLKRGEERLSITTKLPARPDASRQAPTVWLGITGEDQEDEIVIKSVSKDGPAAKAGLQEGDLISSAAGEAVEDYETLIEQVREMSAGEELKLGVTRGDEELELTVTVENRPERQQQPSNRAVMGIQGEDAEGGGAAMTAITDDGPSEKAGLKEGDIVIKVGDKPIADYQALIAEIRSREPEDKMQVTVKRGEEELALEITLGDRSGSSGTRPYTYSYYGQRPNVQDMQGSEGYKYGGVYKSTDEGETWTRVNSLNTRPMYFSVIRVDPSDDQRIYVLGVSQFRSNNGGLTFEANFGRGVHADAHDLWIDPQDGRHMVIGCDGGFYVSYDYGTNWDHINTAAIGQFYHVAISPKEPYWVVGGLQDNGSWAGPAISRSGGAINEDWLSIGGGDGFVCRVDPNDPDLFYYESQNGSMGRRHLRTGERASIRPERKEGVEYRFNWETPFILSHHNSKIFYCAGNYVFRSLDRGNDLQSISPEITLTKRGSATDIAESPQDPNVLYVGTDDGALWVTRDGGREWKNITENLRAPGPRWVASIEASRFAPGRVYVCLDGHRSDDDNPYAFISNDYGDTFQPLHRDLPRGSTRCLREDTVNENLLYLGTEFAFWVTVDRGRHWTQFNQTLPTVAIHDVAIHPTNGEIVLATHGRSLWAANVAALRAIDSKSFSEKVAFYEPTDVIRWRSQPGRGRHQSTL